MPVVGRSARPRYSIVTPVPAGYGEWLADVKARIHAAQQRAALAVNRELVLLYWRLGQEILQRQEQQGWGAKVVAQLAQISATG